MSLAASSLGEHFGRDQKAQFYADAGKTDALAAGFTARRDVVIARQLAALHAGAVVDGDEGSSARVRFERYHGGAGIERVRHHFRKDCLLKRCRVGIAQVFEEMLQIDASFTHWEKS